MWEVAGESASVIGATSGPTTIEITTEATDAASAVAATSGPITASEDIVIPGSVSVIGATTKPIVEDIINGREAEAVVETTDPSIETISQVTDTASVITNTSGPRADQTDIVTPDPVSVIGATTDPLVFEAVVGMPIFYDFYGTLGEANEYFENRLHEHAWSTASPEDRRKALIYATRLIDTLNFKGQKSTVHELLVNKGCSTNLHAAVQAECVTIDEVQEASYEQNTEFPRGDDIYVPRDIKLATYEIAHSLLDDKDPEMELERLSVISQGYASVRVRYDRTHNPLEHLMNMIPNAYAWRLIRPFLRDEDATILRRMS